MNCQIIQLKSNRLSLQVLSSNIANDFKLGQLVEIDKTQYLESKKMELTTAKSFAKIVELGPKTVSIELFKPDLFVIGKIIKLVIVKQQNLFLPQILNQVLVFGDQFEYNFEQTFEFIPTALVGEQVVHGQKIGYISAQANGKHNFKNWILANRTGQIQQIELGDFKIGQQVAIIDKSKVILGSQKNDQTGVSLLLQDSDESKDILIRSTDDHSFKIRAGQSNLVVDINKRLQKLDIIPKLNPDNHVLIFVTKDQNFGHSSLTNSIVLFDKYGFKEGLCPVVNSLALDICRLGYSVLIVTDYHLPLTCLGQYQTINGENVNITCLWQDCYEVNNKNHFDYVHTIE
jgi:hypothetical protein